MCYMCSESKDKYGLDPSYIVYASIFVLILVPVPPKSLPPYAPNHITMHVKRTLPYNFYFDIYLVDVRVYII